MTVSKETGLYTGNSAVIHTYNDGEKKVLVLDDIIGAELENQGFARLPNNPVISPNGNPLTARAATNLAIAEAPDGSVFGVYRGYGEPLDSSMIRDSKNKIREGRSNPFPVFFDTDDITPIQPLPTEPIFTSPNRESKAGIEDGRIARYNGGYFYPFVAAREPTSRGIKFSGAGAILSLDLKLEKYFHLRGIPFFMKDLVPNTKKNNPIWMYFTPRIPNHVKKYPCYKKFIKEHPGIWIAKSYNLRDWQIVGEVLRPLEGEKQIGGGTPLMEEVENLGGSVTYIHSMTGDSSTWREYKARAVLFNPDNPSEPIAMTPDFLIPTESYEKNSDYRISHVFPMGAIKRKVEIHTKVYDAHIISAGTGDVSSSLYIVLVKYLADTQKPINHFKYSSN